jgi:NitT/TauT family transport system permease protein
MTEANEKRTRGSSRGFGDFLTPRTSIPPSLYLVLSLGSFACLLLIWALLTYSGLIDPLFLPTPGRVFQSGVDLFVDFGFTYDIFNST